MPEIRSLASTMDADVLSGRQEVMIGKLVDAVMRNFAKTGRAESACYNRKSIEQQLGRLFPVFQTPDHPPYTLMIEQAIGKLNEEGGSSEESISECIRGEYNNLPWGHTSLMSHHLKKLRERGEIVYTSDKRYKLRFEGNGSTPPAAQKEKFKRGRGRKREMHMQNKKSKRERSQERQNVEAEHKHMRRRKEIEAASENNQAMCSSESNVDRDQTPEQEMLINLRDVELTNNENSRVKGSEKFPLSQCLQYEGVGEAQQVVEKIVFAIDEQMKEQVKVSDKPCYMTGELQTTERELQITDHAKSHQRHNQQHDVIMAPQDQMEAQPISVEDTEPNLADSERRSRIMEIKRFEQSQLGDLANQCESNEMQTEVIKGQIGQCQLLDILGQPVQMREREIRELEVQMKSVNPQMEHNENGLCPHEKFPGSMSGINCNSRMTQDLPSQNPNQIDDRVTTLFEHHRDPLLEKVGPYILSKVQESCLQMLRKTKEMELNLLETLKASTLPEPLNSLITRSICDVRAGILSKVLSMIGASAEETGSSVGELQQLDSLIQVSGTVSCSERSTLFSNSSDLLPHDGAKGLGDLSCREIKHPELSKVQTQSCQRCMLLQHRGDKLSGSPYGCVVALPASEHHGKKLRNQPPCRRQVQINGMNLLPYEQSFNFEVHAATSVTELGNIKRQHLRDCPSELFKKGLEQQDLACVEQAQPGSELSKIEATESKSAEKLFQFHTELEPKLFTSEAVAPVSAAESCALEPREQFQGLNSENVKVLALVSMEERSDPGKQLVQHTHCLEQPLELDEFRKPQDQRGSSEKLLELPISQGAKELTWTESQQSSQPDQLQSDNLNPENRRMFQAVTVPISLKQTTAELMPARTDGFFLTEQSQSTKRTPGQPPQNELQRDNTMPFEDATNRDIGTIPLTSSDPLRAKKQYNKSDTSKMNWAYREKLRLRDLSGNPILPDLSSGVVTDAPCPPGHVSPWPLTVNPQERAHVQGRGITRKRKVDALASQGSSASPFMRLPTRRGRPPKPKLPRDLSV